MKFDVIIGNPPYQLADGAGNGSSTALYDKFIYKAKEMNPKYISMIVPSRWFIGGKGLDKFRKEMINDKRIKEIFHYGDSRELFSDVGIAGGVNYFLWDKNYNGKCKITTTLENESETSIRTLNSDEDKNIFIVNNTLFNIVQKVKSKKEKTFDTLVSPRNPYNIQDVALISNKKKIDSFLLYEQRGVANRYIDKKDVNRLDFHYENRIFISFAYGTLEMKNAQVINQPIIPVSKEAVCSGTYLSIGPFKNEKETSNAFMYIKTRFFRVLVSALKNTQHGTQKTYAFVPLQDFSKPWTDEELYKKYGLTEEEIAYIEEKIRPMD